MVITAVLCFVVIMFIAMAIEAHRRSMKVDLRAVNPTVYVPPPKPPKAIPPSIRAELDDRPEYWDDRFHQLLANLDAASVVGERVETRSWGGGLVAVWEDRGYVDCPCRKCRRICHD